MSDNDPPFPFYPLRVILSIVFVLLGIFVLPAYLGKWIAQPLLWIPLVIFGVPIFPTLTGILMGDTKASLNNIVALYFCETFDLVFQFTFITITLVPIAFTLSSVIAGIMLIVASIALIVWGLVWIGLPIGVRIPDDWMLAVYLWIALIVVTAIQFAVITIAGKYSDQFFDTSIKIHEGGLAWIQRACGARL